MNHNLLQPLKTHAVTGAFGYTGRHITRRLLAAGRRVITLTNTQPISDPFGGAVKVCPLSFRDTGALVAALRGVDVLYNTYWVRFNHRGFSHGEAVENTQTLFRAAREAGVRRIVHVSITNPSADSPLDYFRGKAELEAALRGSGLSYAILRPAVLFGEGDILINNIAWSLRRFPFFMLLGDGQYRLDPIHVDDLAGLAVQAGVSGENVVQDAVGPESFTYRKLVETIGTSIGHSRPLINVPPLVGYAAAKLVGWAHNDVFLTRAEIAGLMAGLLHVESQPTGTTRLSEWLKQHANEVGQCYASELARRRVKA
jgi:uncharacterized protein YbjT (DUF2867 family)